MQTIMEKPPGKLDMIVKRVSVPVGLEELMEGLTKEVLLKKPKDLYLFASEYFSRLIILRERSSTRKAYPIRVVQSVTQAKTPLKPTRHLSRQISVHSKETVMQKDESLKVVASSKVSTPKEKKAPSSESTPRENKRAPSSIRGQQLKPKGKIREKPSVTGRKIDDMIAKSDKKPARYLKKSDVESRKVKMVEAVASEVDDLVGTVAVKGKGAILTENGDNIIDDNPKKSENFAPEDSRTAHSDRRYMSVVGKAVNSLENDSIVLETVEDESKMKTDRANFSHEGNVFKPLGDVDSLQKQKSENLKMDPLLWEGKEIEKNLTAKNPKINNTTLKSSENIEAVDEAYTREIGAVLKQEHSPEMNEDNTHNETLNHSDNLKPTKIEHVDLRGGRFERTENVDKASTLESDNVPGVKTSTKNEETIEANANDLTKNKPIYAIAEERDKESSKEISTNSVIEEDNVEKMYNQVEQVYSEVINTEEIGTELEKQSKIEDNVDSQNEDIKASAISKDHYKTTSKKSTKPPNKEENGSNLGDVQDSGNIQKSNDKVEDVTLAETLLSEATISKTHISKNVEDSANQIKLVNESVDQNDEEINKRKNSKELIYKTKENINYSNNQDENQSEKEVFESENIKTDQPITSLNKNEPSSNTDTEDKLVSIEMQQLGSSDDMLIVSILDRSTPDIATPEITESANSEPKLQFFRKSEELVQKENGKIRQILDVEHLRKLIGTSATSERIDTSTKEFLYSFLTNEQQHSSKDQESCRKIASGAIARKIVEIASLDLKGFEPMPFDEEQVISNVVPGVILATSMPEATTVISEKSHAIQLSEDENIISRDSDRFTSKASDSTLHTQKVCGMTNSSFDFESLPADGSDTIMTALEAAAETVEQFEGLKTTETVTTTKGASDVLSVSKVTTTTSIQVETPETMGNENVSDANASKSAVAISDIVKADAVEFGLTTSTSKQHKSLESIVVAQQVDSQAQKAALERIITDSAVESQNLTHLAETSNNVQFGATNQQISEATSNASNKIVILPIIDSDTSTANGSDNTYIVSNPANLSETKRAYTVQPEEPQQTRTHASNITEHDTFTPSNNVSFSLLQNEQTSSRHILKGASEIEIIASELSPEETTQKALKVTSDISKQPEKYVTPIPASDDSTAKNSETSNSVAEHGKESISSFLERQPFQIVQTQETRVNAYDVTEPEISATANPGLSQYTALESFAAPESVHMRTLTHSFLLGEQQNGGQIQIVSSDQIPVSTIVSEKRKLLTQGETSIEDASEAINDVTTFKQPSSTVASDVISTKMSKGQDLALTNGLDESTNYLTMQLNQEPQSNEAQKTSNKIFDDNPEKSPELAITVSKQSDFPAFKSVKDLLDYDNIYIPKDDFTESSSGAKSLQLIIIDEDRSKENGAAKMKRSTTIEDIEEIPSFADDSVVQQQRGLVGQETLKGFSMESSGDKIETSNSNSSGGSYGGMKSDISTHSVTESEVLVEGRTGEGEAIKEINEQLTVGEIMNKDVNVRDVVSSSVKADVVTSVIVNEAAHVKDEEIKIGSSRNTATALVVDDENVVGAIVEQHDDLAVRCPLNGNPMENHEGFEAKVIATDIKGNIDVVDKTPEDVIAEDMVKDEITKEISNGNTDIAEELMADAPQNDQLVVTSSFKNDQVESNEGFESGTVETTSEANVDTVNNIYKDKVARDVIKDEAIKETSSTNTELDKNLAAKIIVVQNEELSIARSLNCEQMEPKGPDFGTTETALKVNIDELDNTLQETVAVDLIKDEVVKQTANSKTESAERLEGDTIVMPSDDLPVAGSLSGYSVENNDKFDSGTAETIYKTNVDVDDKTNEDIIDKDLVKDEAIRETPTKSTESVERIRVDALTVQNGDLIATSPLNTVEVKNKEYFETGITETVTKVLVDEVDKTLTDIITINQIKDETVKEISYNKTEPSGKNSEDATTVRNKALTIIGALNGNQVTNNEAFELVITETVPETKVDAIGKAHEDISVRDPLKDKTIEESPNNNTESTEKCVANDVVVQNDDLAVLDPFNCNQMENKKGFESEVTKTASNTNVGKVNEIHEDMVTIDSIKDEAVKEIVNNNTVSAEMLMADVVAHGTQKFAKEVILNGEPYKDIEDKDTKEPQAFSKENTFIKDAEPKQRPKIEEIKRATSVIEVVKTTPMVTKRETSPKKPIISRLAFKERSFSHSNVLIRERSKSSSSERGEPKLRRARSVGVLKSQEAETKSRIPTSDSRRSAGRRPLVRQLEANSSELAEKLNFKRSSDGESGEGDEREEENSVDAKLIVKTQEILKEVDPEKVGSSAVKKYIAINEGHVAMEVDGAKEQNSGYDKSAVKLDEVVKKVDDVTAGGVTYMEKVENFRRNNDKDNAGNSIDIRSPIEVKEIAKSIVKNVETLATEAVGNRNIHDLEPAKEDNHVFGGAAAEEFGRAADAAIKIQSAWKGFVAKKMLIAQRKEKAVVKIQTVVRRFLIQLHLDKMKSTDIDSSVEQPFKDTITDFSDDVSLTGHAKDEQATLVDESNTAQTKLDRNITVESVHVLSDSSGDTKNDFAITNENTTEGLASKPVTIASHVNSADKYLKNYDETKHDASRCALEDGLGRTKEKDRETLDANTEDLEIDDLVKHGKIPLEPDTLADNKKEDVPVSSKSLQINDLQHEADNIEAEIIMKKKDYTHDEAAGLIVGDDMPIDNTNMEAKRNGDIAVRKTGFAEEGNVGFENVKRKADINDENLQIKDEDEKKSNDIEENIKIKGDSDTRAIKSYSGKDETRNVGLKADAKQKKDGRGKREADINAEDVKINVNDRTKRKNTDDEEDFGEGENVEPSKENDVLDKVTKVDKIVDEESRTVDEGRVVQETFTEKDIPESNIKDVVNPKEKEALSTSIAETTKINIDEVVTQPQQADAVNFSNVITAKVPDQLDKQEQQSASSTETNKILNSGFSENLVKTIDAAESSEVLKAQAVQLEKGEKGVAENRIDRKKIEESADIDGTKTKITEESIKVSSNLKEISPKISELIIEDGSKDADDPQIVIDRGASYSEIAQTTVSHVEDDNGSSKDDIQSIELVTKEVKPDVPRNEATENNGGNKVYGDAKSQFSSNWKVEDASQLNKKNHGDTKFIDLSQENAAQLLDDNKINESTTKKVLDSKPDFYRSDTVVEPLLVNKTVPYVGGDTIDSNNNTSKEETPLEEGIRIAVAQIVKPTDVDSHLQTLPGVLTQDLPPAEDDLSSYGSTDSVVTVIMKPKHEVTPRTLPGRAFSTSALEDRVELLDQVQNSLLDQLSGKSKFDIEQLRKELHDATLYKEDSPPEAEVLEYLYDFDPDDDSEYDRVARTPLRELPDIAEEDDVPETSGGLSNEIVINNDSIKIGKEHQRLLHTGELHDSVILTNGKPLKAGNESRNRLKHTSEFHDTVVVPLPSGADVKITNASKAAATVVEGAEQNHSDCSGAEYDSTDNGNHTSDQQPPAGAEAMTSQDVGGAEQAAFKDAAPAGPESARPAQSPARTANEAMESENNNNKRNNAISTNVPERNMETQAATKIQAGFRGYQVRKQLKAKNTALDQKRQLRKRTSRDNLKNPDLEEKSAVKIQAGVRGFLVRRRQKKQASNSSASA